MTSSLRVSDPISFKIQIPEERIELLQKKLALSVLPDELEDSGWFYGVPLTDVQRLLTRWKSGYNWRKYEKELNDELPQFQTDIDVDGFGVLKVHFVHKKSEVPGAIPLLFVHGYEHPSFHVVTYSLPGFGFSEAPKRKGFSLNQYAEVGNKLMLSLGYDEYVTQGGDWGQGITSRIASIYGGKHSKAWHTNNPLPVDPDLIERPPKFFAYPWLYLSNIFFTYSPAEIDGMKRKEWLFREGRGYYAEQATQPQTLGYSLSDSPVGLLAWIYEKLVNWCDDYPWEDDEVLNWVSVYWFSTGGPTASTRIYYEKEHERKEDVPRPPRIPYGASFYPKELTGMPRSWTKTKYRVFEAEKNAGGHFAAYEQPKSFVEDLRKMFGRGGPAYCVIKSKPGY